MKKRSRRMRITGIVAALAMLLPALIPAGYMPMVDLQAGSLSIVVCPEQGCPFGVAAGPLDLADEPMVAFVPHGNAAVMALPALTRRPIVAGPPLPGRGPPPLF